MRKLSLQTIDNVNEWFGRLVSYLILGIIGITIWEVVLRYLFNSPTVWVSETSEFLFAYCFLLGGAYTLAVGGHVGVDVISSRLSPRAQAFLSLFTFIFFLLFTGLLLLKGSEMAWESVTGLERSQSPWGPYTFHVILTVPIAALMMLLQGLAKFIRDLRKLRGNEK